MHARRSRSLSARGDLPRHDAGVLGGVSLADEICPELRERIAAYISDLDAGNDEARELLVDVADGLDIDFRRRDSI